MHSKYQLVSSVIQVIIGIAAIASFFVLAANGEDMTRWIVTFILAAAFIVLGVIGLVDYKKHK